MQLVSIFLESERGEELGHSSVNFAKIIKEGWRLENWKSKYQWLSTIDPYGNTIFNVHQVPIIIKELELLKKEIEYIKIISEIDQTIEFLKKCEQHLYMKFVGD